MTPRLAKSRWISGNKAGVDFTLPGNPYNYNSRNQNYRGASAVTSPSNTLSYYIDDGAVRDQDYNIIYTFIPNTPITQPYVLLPVFFDSVYAVISTATNTLGVLITENEVIREDVLLDDFSVRATAALTENKDAYHIITHSQIGNQINVFRLNIENTLLEDLNNNIGIQNVGFSANVYPQGAMKFDPSGKYILNTISQPYNRIEVFSFNECTGVISEIDAADAAVFKDTPYLYSAEWFGNNIIFTSNNSESICEDPLASIGAYDFSNLQFENKRHIISENIHFGDLAENENELYVSRFNQKELGVLNSNLEYRLKEPVFCPPDSSFKYSLQNAPFLGEEDGLNLGIISDGDGLFCEGEEINVTLSISQQFEEYRWYLNGTEIPNEQESQLTATQTGRYNVAAWNNTTGICGNKKDNYSVSGAYIISTEEETEFPDITISTKDLLITCEGGNPSLLRYETPDFDIDRHNDNVAGNFEQDYPYGADPFEIRWFVDQEELTQYRNQVEIATTVSGEYRADIVKLTRCEAANSSNILNYRIRAQEPPETALANSLETEDCPPPNGIMYFSQNTDAGLTYQWLQDNNVISEGRFFTPPEEGMYVLQVTENINGCISIGTEEFEVSFLGKIELFIYTNDSLYYCENEIINTELIPVLDNLKNLELFQLKWFKNEQEFIIQETTETLPVSEAGVYKAELLLKNPACDFSILSNEVAVNRIEKPEAYILSYDDSAQENRETETTVTLNNERVNLEFEYNGEGDVSDWIGDANIARGEANLKNNVLELYPTEAGTYTYSKEITLGEEVCRTPCIYKYTKIITFIESEAPEVIVENESGCETRDGSAFLDLKNTSVDDWMIIWSTGNVNTELISNLTKGSYAVSLMHVRNSGLSYDINFLVQRDESCEQQTENETNFIITAAPQSICAGSQTTISAPYRQNRFYEWYRNGSLFRPAEDDLFEIQTSNPGIYQARYQNIIGESPDPNKWIESNELEIELIGAEDASPVFLDYNGGIIENRAVVQEGEILNFDVDPEYQHFNTRGLNQNSDLTIENLQVGNSQVLKFDVRHIQTGCEFEQPFVIDVKPRIPEQNIVEFEITNPAGQILDDVTVDLYESTGEYRILNQPCTEITDENIVLIDGYGNRQEVDDSNCIESEILIQTNEINTEETEILTPINNQLHITKRTNSDLVTITAQGYTSGILKGSASQNIYLTSNEATDIGDANIEQGDVYFELDEEGKSPYLPISQNTQIEMIGGSGDVEITHLPYVKKQESDFNIGNKPSIGIINTNEWASEPFDISPIENRKNPLIEKITKPIT